ncbi:MAG: trypsin-like peptidase domain-containing protein [Planctomycetes bacterium]|nr:trypsin-like peptidase domain-containing protein [Planctomycetota bacterium]
MKAITTVILLCAFCAVPLAAQDAKLHKELEAHRLKLSRAAAKYVVSVEIDYDREGLGTGFMDPDLADGFFRYDVGPFSGTVVGESHVLISDRCLGKFSTKGADISVDSIVVTLPNGDRHKATVVGRHQQLDLALLKVDAKLTEVKDIAALAFPKDEVALERGQQVTVVGRGQNPLRVLVNDGVVSAIERENKRAFQLDARIGNATLGAPVMDNDGKFVGVVSLHNHQTFGQASGVSNAVYAHEARRAYELMKEGKFIERPPEPYMGVSVNKKWPDKPGLVVGEVSERSGAQKAGIKLEDVILKVDGVDMVNAGDLRTHILGHKVGDVLKVTILRDEKEITLDVTLGARP